jgi:ABC-type phosphate/phosphonate transport system substrate-binding protein
MNSRYCRKIWMTSVVILLLACSGPLLAGEVAEPLNVVVMDPLALPLACDCVEGYAQRDYDRLGEYLEGRIGCPVRVVFRESLISGLRARDGVEVGLIIGKDSVIRFDARKCQMEVQPIAMLTGQDGKATFTGLFVLPAADPAKKLADLKGYRIIFGPEASAEKNTAAVAALRAAGLAIAAKLEIDDSCSGAAIKALESDTKPGTAAVISSYAKAIMEGCGAVDKGELRVIGNTAPLPFVRVFATDVVGPAMRKIRSQEQTIGNTLVPFSLRSKVSCKREDRIFIS